MVLCVCSLSTLAEPPLPFFKACWTVLWDADTWNEYVLVLFYLRYCISCLCVPETRKSACGVVYTVKKPRKVEEEETTLPAFKKAKTQAWGLDQLSTGASIPSLPSAQSSHHPPGSPVPPLLLHLAWTRTILLVIQVERAVVVRLLSASSPHLKGASLLTMSCIFWSQCKLQTTFVIHGHVQLYRCIPSFIKIVYKNTSSKSYSYGFSRVQHTSVLNLKTARQCMFILHELLKVIVQQKKKVQNLLPVLCSHWSQNKILGSATC